MALLTVGHGPQGRDALGPRLAGAGVEVLVDVRRFPGSRNNPDVAREALESWLPELGIGYRWDERLAGRRRLVPGQPVVDDWWTVAQFAAYAVMPDGRLTPHRPSAGAVVTAAGTHWPAIMEP